jgi:hypothetical protein
LRQTFITQPMLVSNLQSFYLSLPGAEIYRHMLLYLADLSLLELRLHLKCSAKSLDQWSPYYTDPLKYRSWQSRGETEHIVGLGAHCDLILGSDLRMFT